MSFQDTLRSFHKQQTKILQSENITPRTSISDATVVNQIENMKNKKENSNLSDILNEEEQVEKEIGSVVDRLKIMLNGGEASTPVENVIVDTSLKIKQGLKAKIATPRKPKKPNIII
jgi:glutamate mutase epsilon subunit